MKLRTRVLACATSLSLLSACSVSDITAPIDSITGPASSGASSRALVVGDEPFAVKAAASVLNEGGSAADAATAMYFALAVTYPVSAGLGGGGICIVHDSASGRSEEFDFLARDAGVAGPYAVPGAVRGFAMLQTIYGALPWQRDVSPGEGLAATGFPISHALAVRLNSSQEVIRLDAGLASEFMDEAGRVKQAGTVVFNTDLATTLAAIRTGGPDALYRGNAGARLLAYTQQQGAGISVAEFAQYKVVDASPQTIAFGSQQLFIPQASTGAGAFAGSLFSNLARAEQTSTGSTDLQASVVYSVKQALAQFNVANLPQDLGATGFAATDARGQSVACAVTMNGPFGSGHTVPGTGVTLARAPSSGGTGVAAAFLTPVIAVDSGGGLSLAGAGAGGPNGTAAIGYALSQIAHGSLIATRADLRSTGVAPYDTVNAIICQSGGCVALPDPGANGLGAAGEAGR
ncbi:MAG TPA: gamma-glutamyltransferase [Rhizomicrobium sp.]|nr:gamma-glutamyltransferase [Rhizomicrobium sp.]